MHLHPDSRRGLIDTAPLLLTIVPLAASFGALGIAQGESPWLLILCSVAVFAGSAQLLALGMLAAGAPLWLILLATLVINSRHLFYAFSLTAHVQQYPVYQRALMAFVLNDESYAVVSRQPPGHGFLNYYLASGFMAWASWCGGTGLGILIALLFAGQLPTALLGQLDIIMVLTFISLMAPRLQHRSHWLCAITATVSISLCWHWPLGSGLLFSALLAIGIALLAEGTEPALKHEKEVCE